MRGNDINFNPLFLAYLVIIQDKESEQLTVNLYADKTKFKEHASYLQDNKIILHNYENIWSDKWPIEEIIADLDQINCRLADYIESLGIKIIPCTDPVAFLKVHFFLLISK